MRMLVLGAGLMSRAAVHDYLLAADVEQVVVADVSSAALERLTSALDDVSRVRTIELDASDAPAVEALMHDADAVFCGVHYGFNVEFARAAIATGTHMVDLGGNNDVVRAELALDADARAAGVSIIPDCGLAPGLASMLVAWGMERFEQVDGVHIKVGGLPLEPTSPFEYGRLFSVEGLINEYVEPPLVQRDGKLVVGEPLGDVEEVDFGDPVGMLEAFNTSGGLSTLAESYGDRVRDLDYKTLRYPGHALAMRWLWQLGLMSSDPIDHDGRPIVPRAVLRQLIEASVPVLARDRTLVRVEFHGTGMPGGTHRIEIVEEYDEQTRLTAMSRLTAWPATSISLMQARGQVTPGASPQERAVDPSTFVDGLLDRGISITGVVRAATSRSSSQVVTGSTIIPIKGRIADSNR